MDDFINDIRRRQNEIVDRINSTFDMIVEQVMQLNGTSIEVNNEYEKIYPVTNSSLFKGKKVIAIILNGDRIVVSTWRNVVKLVLEDVMKDEVRKRKMYSLRDRLLGRTRKRLSADSSDMRNPLKLSENLYIETHYDTETLINLLLQILGEVSYDFSNVKIVVKSQ